MSAVVKFGREKQVELDHSVVNVVLLSLAGAIGNMLNRPVANSYRSGRNTGILYPCCAPENPNGN